MKGCGNEEDDELYVEVNKGRAHTRPSTPGLSKRSRLQSYSDARAFRGSDFFTKEAKPTSFTIHLVLSRYPGGDDGVLSIESMPHDTSKISIWLDNDPGHDVCEQILK